MTDVRSTSLTSLTPPRFDTASAEVLAFLRSTFPIGTWTVTRFDGEQQIFLTVDDTDFGVSAGDALEWSDSMCQYTVGNTRPTFVADIQASPEHAAVIEKSGFPVASYVGYPLVTSDGKLFGTLCGFGREQLSANAPDHEPLIVLLVSLLSRILEADLQATAVSRALEATQRRADTDALTGLTNRDGWQRLLEAEDGRFRRFGDPGAVIIIDLDDLKGLNDSQGHHAGDDHLRELARLMTEVVDLPGVVARIGGDEFAILLSNVSGSTVKDVVTRLRTTFSDNDVSASIGHAVYSAADGLDGAWRSADAAMYTEKMSKRAYRTRPAGSSRSWAR